MKRILAIILTLCLVAVLIPMPASGAVYAQGQCGDHAYWTLDENGTLTIYGSGVADPYYPLPSWQKSNGMYTGKIKNVVIKSGITKIGNSSFADCINLTSVVIPETVTSIGSSAFYRCGKLSEIILPAKLVSLGGSAFANSGIQAITIPETITTVSGGLFKSCYRLTTVTFKGAVKDIGNSAFSGCGVLETVAFEKGLSGTIGKESFAYCDKLKQIDVPEGVTDIKEHAFCGSTNLASVSLPESLISLGNSAFRETALVSVTIPKNVKYLGDDPFVFCYELKNITVYSASMEGLRGTLGGEEALEYIHIIGDAPQSEKAKINSRNEDFVIYYDEGTSGWVSPSWRGWLIRPWGQPDAPITGTCGKNLTWSLKSGVLTISGSGPMDSYSPFSVTAPWYLCKKQITQVIIEEGAESIGNGAFYDLHNLTSVSIPGSVKIIEHNAFEKCVQLKQIHIPFGVEELGTFVFDACTELTKVSMADSVTEIGWHTFGGCTKLENVRLSDNLTTIPSSLFSGCEKLTTVNIPAKCTTISGNAFRDCAALTEISIPDGVTTIISGAFHNSGLVEVTIPASVTMLSGFSGCKLLKYMQFLGDAPTIENDSFYDTTVACTYPAGNDTWTDAVKQNYGGTVTWIPDDHVHTYEKVFVEPDCTKQGYHGQRCSACGHTYAQEYVDALGHDMTEATCTQLSTCRRENCGYQDGKLRDHLFEDSCRITRTCDVCGYTDNYGGAKPHTWEDPCMTTRTCSVCGYSDNNGGHNWHNEAGDMRYCFTCGEFEGGYLLDLEGINETVWFGTAEYYSCSSGTKRIVLFKDPNVGFMMTYTYNDTESIDPHNKYPTGMKVWRLTLEGDRYTATRVEELDNILQYAGSSIRVAGTKGIRMITSIEKSKKQALTGKGLAGYKLVEYGTALCWAKDLGDEKKMVLEKDFVKSNYAYKKGVADPIFAQTKDAVQYTNVLVGFTLEQCKQDIAMRPYMILEDADGTQFTIYGGIVYRSIGYIASQNRHVFQPGTSSYRYVWEIVRKVYGSKYDAEYKY